MNKGLKVYQSISSWSDTYLPKKDVPVWYVEHCKNTKVSAYRYWPNGIMIAQVHKTYDGDWSWTINTEMMATLCPAELGREDSCEAAKEKADEALKEFCENNWKYIKSNLNSYSNRMNYIKW